MNVIKKCLFLVAVLTGIIILAGELGIAGLESSKVLIATDIIQANEAAVSETLGLYAEIDRFAMAVIAGALMVILFMVYFIVSFVKQVWKEQRVFDMPNWKSIAYICLLTLILVVLVVVVHKLPGLIFDGITWGSIGVWATQRLMISLSITAVAIVLIYLYLIADLLYKRKGDDSIPFFFTVLMSLITGAGNALIIFMINESLRREDGLQTSLLLLFVIGVVVYVFGSRVVRARLIKINNNMIYKLRMELTNKILNTTLENIEKLDDGVIQSTLNNDTETVSTSANYIVSLLTSSATILFCFVYLSFISVTTLLICIITLVVTACIYFVVFQSANKLFEEVRTTQSTFFKFIKDMMKGFKELRLNYRRRKAFEEDVDQLSNIYSKKRAKVSLSFADAFVVGGLMINLTVGFVVFFFPIIFLDLQIEDIRSYAFVLLYLIAPINGILSGIPSLAQIRVSWKRINKLVSEISGLSDERICSEKKCEEITPMSLELRNIEYEYSVENVERFKIGPVSYKFNSGEIIFITGGNGSGKSTLAKIITGLYCAQSGEILLNGRNIPPAELEQSFAAIFGDFHLFDKLYGIDYILKQEELKKYMNTMQLNDKVKLENGCFSTTNLSTGQRKRLALVISYLEDRPMYLFDEWAADQDPEFRDFFYRELLPELKKNGKCVIAITHDDRYFDIADRLIKMELGKVVYN